MVSLFNNKLLKRFAFSLRDSSTLPSKRCMSITVNADNRHDRDSWYSRPLDVHIWSDYKEVSDLVLSIFKSFSGQQRETLKGKSNNQGRASGLSHLQLVLVDLFVAWKNDPALSIGVARGNDAYRVNSRYNALHISPRIRPVIDTLNDNGLIDYIGGSHDRCPPDTITRKS